MPRDIGTGLYTYPAGTEGNTAQTIFSARYNTFINDLANTLNQSLPVNMGGTGADNAKSARDNLDTEVAGQLVTNYDTHVWENGSFASWNATAGPPTPSAPLGDLGIFSGVCHKTDNDHILLEAHEYTAGGNTNIYIREKDFGIWKPWVIGGQTSQASADARYVNVAGDTMTGNLTIHKSEPSILLLKTDAASSNSILGYGASGTVRWQIAAGNGEVESGANAGSNFGISRFSDTGAFLATAVQVFRSSGDVRVFSSTPTGSPTTGALTVPSGGLGVAGGINAGGIIATACGTIAVNALAGGNAHFTMRDENSVNKAFCYWSRASDAIVLQNTSGTLNVASTGLVSTSSSIYANGNLTCTGAADCAGSYKGRAGAGGAGSNVFNINWTGVPQLWIDTTNVGNISLVSDYRTKKDVVDLPSTWDTVKALRPIKYTQAQFSPPSHVKYVAEENLKARKEAEDNPKAEPREVNAGPMFAADNIERWGFIAHELQATLTESAATGVKDSPNEIQSPNPFTLIAALTKALQEAMARIEALEAAQAPP